MTASATKEVQLKRELGLFSASNLIMGTMIGSGIFVTPGTAFGYIGSVAMTLIIWAFCGLVCLLGALAYAELGTVVPRSGSEYAYFMESFGRLHKFWGPLVGFLYSFVIVLVVRPVEVAVIVIVSGTYITNFINQFVCMGDENVVQWISTVISLMEICIITYINAASVKLYVKVQNLFTILKIVCCLMIIGGGIYELARGNLENINKGFEGTTLTPKAVALSFFSGLWAYDGWSCVTLVTEEIKRPEKNILRSILIAIPLMTAFYVFMNVSYMTVLTKQEMTSSKAVAMDFAERVLSYAAYFIPMGVSISAFGCAMAVQFGVTRICYVAGQEGHLLPILSYVHTTRLTPCLGVLLQGIVSFFVIFIGDIGDLIDFVSFLLWLGYGLAMVSLLIMRRTHKDVKRPFKVPLFIVVLILLVSVFLFFVPIITDPSYKYFIAVGLILLGVLFYYIFAYKHIRLNCIDSVTRFLQKLFQVAPSSPSVLSQTGSVEDTGRSSAVEDHDKRS